MSDKPVCHRCGYVGPVDARYCAHCGRALVSPNARLTRSINRILSNLSPYHIGFLGLVLSVPTGYTSAGRYEQHSYDGTEGTAWHITGADAASPRPACASCLGIESGWGGGDRLARRAAQHQR